jgi:hypothetical protein
MSGASGFIGTTEVCVAMDTLDVASRLTVALLIGAALGLAWRLG